MKLIKSNKDIPKPEKEMPKFILNTGLNIFYKELNKIFLSIAGSGRTLTNNEMKDTIKVIRFLDNREIFLKGTTKNITCWEGWFLNFLRPLMTTALPLMKNVLTPSAKSVLVSLGLTA